MNQVAHQHSYSFSQPPSAARALLVQLINAHDQLVAEMENFDRITQGAELQRGELTRGRWRISQASLKRRSLACRVFDFLSDRLKGLDFATLKSVQSADQQMMRRSAAHVGNWTIKKISDDWQGYCEASRQIRMRMREHIQLERQSLYPILEQLGDRGH